MEYNDVEWDGMGWDRPGIGVHCTGPNNREGWKVLSSQSVTISEPRAPTVQLQLRTYTRLPSQPKGDQTTDDVRHIPGVYVTGYSFFVKVEARSTTNLPLVSCLHHEDMTGEERRGEERRGEEKRGEKRRENRRKGKETYVCYSAKRCIRMSMYVSSACRCKLRWIYSGPCPVCPALTPPHPISTMALDTTPSLPPARQWKAHSLRSLTAKVSGYWICRAILLRMCRRYSVPRLAYTCPLYCWDLHAKGWNKKQRVRLCLFVECCNFWFGWFGWFDVVWCLCFGLVSLVA